ncbi:MAG: hypothetical protein CMJ78_02680 [Planctomycetaceae bacterium]|nr:hypothetical protein [Planctomycetaceae bacterium]
MPDHERGMLIFTRLAVISHEKQQAIGRDKFLILAAVEACRAGWLEVSEKCRQLVTESNPLHLLNRYETVADALRSEDFQSFARQLERFCSLERGEHLLTELGIEPLPPDGSLAGNFCEDLLDME